MNDGRKIIVNFNNTTKGGSITIKNAAGTNLVNETLPTTIQALTLYK